MNLLRLSSRLVVIGALLAAMPITLPRLAHARVVVQAEEDAATHTWQLQFKKGDVLKYRTVTNITGPLPNDQGDFHVDVTTLLSQEVKSLSEKGEATVVTTIQKNEATINGQKLPDDPAQYPIITEVFSKNGLVLKHEVENAQPGLEKFDDLTAMLSNMPTPDKPVKIGDSWKTELENRLVKGKKVTLTSTLVGKEKVGDADTFKVKVETEIPMMEDAGEKDTIKVAGTYNIDAAAGRFLRADYTVENAELPTQVGPVRVKVKQTVNYVAPGSENEEK
jgi:hypothetical protein